MSNALSMRIPSLLVVVGSFVLSGCASVFSMGEPEYSCPGGKDGVRCMSAKDVYHATENADQVAPQNEDNKSGKKKDSEVVPDQKPVVRSQSNPTIKIGNLVPIRTPARIMRIAVNTWEDESRRLHGGQFVFTEIESRKWNVGEQQTPFGSALAPFTPLVAPRAPHTQGNTESPLGGPPLDRAVNLSSQTENRKNQGVVQ